MHQTHENRLNTYNVFFIFVSSGQNVWKAKILRVFSKMEKKFRILKDIYRMGVVEKISGKHSLVNWEMLVRVVRNNFNQESIFQDNSQ